MGHRVIFLDQAKVQYVFYSLGVIPHRIIISREITNLVGERQSALQWTRWYCPPGSSLMFESYFPLINAFHVNWLSRRHQFSSIPASAAASRMVSPTCIMLASTFLTLLLIDWFCRASWVEVWQNMRSVDGSSPHSSVGDPIMRLHDASLTFASAFWSPPPGGLLDYFSWVSALSLFRRLHRPQFSHVAQTWAGCWTRWIENFYESYN